MSNHDDGKTDFFTQIFKKRKNGLRAFRIKRTRALIAKKVSGFHSKSAGNGDALFLPAAEFIRAFSKFVLYASQFSEAFDTFPDFLCRKMPAFHRK